MKVTVTIDGRSYAVEVGDVYSRPIVAVVEGRRIEVWPEGNPGPAAAPAVTARTPLRAPAAASAASGPAGLGLRAPIPGVIAAVSVQPGSAVTVGQELLVIEAMKMKNALRAARDGEIGALHVSVGQTVRQGDLLLEYAG